VPRRILAEGWLGTICLPRSRRRGVCR
jgi:hypothetical protein